MDASGRGVRQWRSNPPARSMSSSRRVSRFLLSQLRRIGLGHPLGRGPLRTTMPAMGTAIGVHDAGLLAGRGDGHLRSAFGALGSSHDLLAKSGYSGPGLPTRTRPGEHRPVLLFAGRQRGAAWKLRQRPRTTAEWNRGAAGEADAERRSETGSAVRVVKPGST
jgi:hypothetical protein